MLNEEKSTEKTLLSKDNLLDKITLLESLHLEKERTIALENQLAIAQRQLEKSQAEITWFKEQFKLQQQRLFGRSSEASATSQMDWVFNEVGLAVEYEDAVTSEESLIQGITDTRKKIKSCGRKLNTASLPRERHWHDLSDAEKICACGHTLEKIGEDISEQIEHIPEQLKVIEHVRCKYTCRFCETIKTAEKPETVIPKSMAGAGLIAEVMIKKYEHHLPLYRQSKIFLQQGCDIPDNTLGNWVMQGAQGLEPLGAALWEQLFYVKVLQTDETPVKVLEPDKQGYLWSYHSCDPPNRFITFEFHLTRSGEVVKQRLKHYRGILQTDGYSGYNGMRNQADVIALGCWDHARRKFTEVIKINNNNATGQAGMLLSLINKLYQVEAEAKGKSFTERHELRQEKAKLILEKIHERLMKINVAPQSALGKAVTYAINQWPYLIKYIDHGEAEISNCWIENQIRPFALGRRNWLFVGNEISANRSALLYSLIQTCKLNGINARQYLAYVLNQTHKMRRREIEPITLLPQFIDKNLFK